MIPDRTKESLQDLLPHLPYEAKKAVAAFSFSRWGGVSRGPFSELNVGHSTGDDPEAVERNIELVRQRLGLSRLAHAKQVHGSEFIHVDSLEDAALSFVSRTEADGLFTCRAGVGLMIKTADCQPVVMFDPVRRVVGNIHCGWRGSVDGILIKAVVELETVYGCRPEDLFVGIGPSLGPCCAEFRDWERLLPGWMAGFQPRPDYFDFWQISKRQLINSGIPEDHIHCAGKCTVCSPDHFSYRREGRTGRLATVVALKG